MKKFVFDSSALICFLDGEPNADKVSDILEDINEKDLDAYLCVINMGEVYYHFLRTGGLKTAKVALDTIQTLPLSIIDVDYDLTIEASNIKAHNKMAYADCFAAALAKRTSSQLVSSDKEFRQVEKDIKIHWI